MEIWKDIEGYESYQVSNLGNVKSLNYWRTGTINILKPWLVGIGYFEVRLFQDSKKKKKYIHRLVAQAFIPNPDNKPEIDHINTIKTDNRVENLQWVTRKENQNNPITRHKNSISKIGEKSHNYGKFGALSKKAIPIIQYSKNGDFIAEYGSIIDAGREIGVNKGNISSALKGRYKTAGGYVWKYKN